MSEIRNENMLIPYAKEDSELDAAIDKSLDTLPLEDAEIDIVAKIIEAPTRDELQKQFDLFNMNQSKKNALRIVKLNTLLDKVQDQAIERFEKRPDQVSNRELLDYMNVVSGQIDRAQKQVDTLSMTPTIQVTQQKNEVNINVNPGLDRDSKERVMDAISALLKQVNNKVSTPVEPSNTFISDNFEEIDNDSDMHVISSVDFNVEDEEKE